jgi:hypothetical protein
MTLEKRNSYPLSFVFWGLPLLELVGGMSILSFSESACHYNYLRIASTLPDVGISSGFLMRVVLFGICYLILWAVCYFLRIKPNNFVGIFIIALITIFIYLLLLISFKIIDRLYDSLMIFPPLLGAYMDDPRSAAMYLFLIFPFTGCCIIIKTQNLAKRIKKRNVLVSILAILIWGILFYTHIGFVAREYFTVTVRVLVFRDYESSYEHSFYNWPNFERSTLVSGPASMGEQFYIVKTGPSFTWGERAWWLSYYLKLLHLSGQNEILWKIKELESDEYRFQLLSALRYLYFLINLLESSQDVKGKMVMQEIFNHAGTEIRYNKSLNSIFEVNRNKFLMNSKDIIMLPSVSHPRLTFPCRAFLMYIPLPPGVPLPPYSASMNQWTVVTLDNTGKKTISGRNIIEIATRAQNIGDYIEVKGENQEYERIVSYLSRWAILAEELWREKDLEGCRKFFMFLQEIVTITKNSKRLQMRVDGKSVEELFLEFDFQKEDMRLPVVNSRNLFRISKK